MATQWNDQEEAALMYLSHRAQVLYLRGLRRFMDYTSGIVGQRRRISYQQLKECLEVHPPAGSDARRYVPTRDELRASLAQLLRAGLIVRIKTAKMTDPMRFFLPLATIRLEEQRTSNPLGSTPDDFLAESSDNEEATPKQPHRGNPTPLVSGTTNPTHRARTLIPADFKPDEATLTRLRFSGGIERPTAAKVLLFVCENQSSGWASADWQAEYLRWEIKKTFSKGSGTPRPKSGAQLLAEICGPAAFAHKEQLCND